MLFDLRLDPLFPSSGKHMPAKRRSIAGIPKGLYNVNYRGVSRRLRDGDMELPIR
jgi:hypothetical protein